MSDSPEIKYVTISNPSQLKGPKPCTCGCGGRPRHRVKVTMPEWADEGPGGKLEAPQFWATKLSAGERDRHRASLEEFDKTLGIFVRHPEWSRFHWLAVCLRDNQNHRVWEDLEDARRQLAEYDDDEIEKLVSACDAAQRQPARAEGNDVPCETTQNDKPSGDTLEAADTPILIGS